MRVLLYKLVKGVFIFSLLLISACSHIGYYKQSAAGHLKILSASEPIDKVLEDPETKPKLKHQLLLISETLDFAQQELLLKTGDSYRQYADLNRPYVVWNIFAAPQLSLQPKQWCFLIVGCLTYKGFFARQDAEQLALSLKQQGYDVYLGGVTAYSTLGWFADPVLSTMLKRDDRALVKLIIHELVHQNIYLKHDTNLNEAVAEAIALIALSRWDSSDKNIYRQLDQHNHDLQEDMITLILNYQDKLTDLYQSKQTDEEKLIHKQVIFQQLQNDYAILKQQYPDTEGYDAWFAKDLNNAKIASVSTYRQLVPELLEIYQKLNTDLQKFYFFIQQLEKCDRDSRHQKVQTKNLAMEC